MVLKGVPVEMLHIQPISEPLWGFHNGRKVPDAFFYPLHPNQKRRVSHCADQCGETHPRSPGLDRGVGLALGPCRVTGGNRCRTDAAPATVTGTTPTSPLDLGVWEGWGEDDRKPGYSRDGRTKTSGGGVGGSHGENHPHPEGISGEIK